MVLQIHNNHPLIGLKYQQNVSGVVQILYLWYKFSFASSYDVVAWVFEINKVQLCMCILVI